MDVRVARRTHADRLALEVAARSTTSSRGTMPSRSDARFAVHVVEERVEREHALRDAARDAVPNRAPATMRGIRSKGRMRSVPRASAYTVNVTPRCSSTLFTVVTRCRKSALEMPSSVDAERLVVGPRPPARRRRTRRRPAPERSGRGSSACPEGFTPRGAPPFAKRPRAIPDQPGRDFVAYAWRFAPGVAAAARCRWSSAWRRNVLMTAWRLMLRSWAAWSSSASIGAVKSTLTRWIAGGIMRPRFVK